MSKCSMPGQGANSTIKNAPTLITLIPPLLTRRVLTVAHFCPVSACPRQNYVQKTRTEAEGDPAILIDFNLAAILLFLLLQILSSSIFSFNSLCCHLYFQNSSTTTTTTRTIAAVAVVIVVVVVVVVVDQHPLTVVFCPSLLLRPLDPSVAIPRTTYSTGYSQSL
jgi:hypothetical protein